MDDELYKRHADAIICFFRSLVSEGVEDLVQETFERMLRGQHRIRAGTDPQAYLFGIAWNVWREHLRELGRDRMVDPEIESMAALQPGPSTIAARRRDRRMLAEALRRLPEQHQTALELYYWGRLTYAEIADHMKISTSAMCDRMRRARFLLRQELAQLERTTPLIVSTSTPR